MIRFPQYFEGYGGLNQVVQSLYFWTSIVLVLVVHRYFIAPGWWDLVLSVVPGLVGFSIAGVAIFISLGSAELRSVIAGKRAGSSARSPFMRFMAMFTHFIVVQLLALIIAFVAKAFYEVAPISGSVFVGLAEGVKCPFWLAGGLFFSYAVMLCIALAVEIYRLASMIDDFQTVENEIASSTSKQ